MKWFLVLKLSWPGGAYHIASAQFPDMDTCLKVLEKAEIKIPEHNAENEWAGFKICLPETLFRVNK